MARKLKVFRATSGFHDSFVAAPSRAAALRAWGANTDLFAMGAAEEVDDPELTKKPLASPGTIFKVRRGAGAAAAVEHRPKPARKRSRAALDRAEQALEAMQAAHAAEAEALDRRFAKLEQAKQAMLARHQREAERKEAARRAAEEKYTA